MRVNSTLCATGPRPLVNTGVHERIENEQIAALRERCQEGKICDVAASKEKRCLRAKELSRFCFEPFMLLAIAAQKPRPAGSNRSARLERGESYAGNWVMTE
ncbi:hypothetical protein ACVIU7_005120 [Bradyrhizobium liaoningense]|nr:hypothetical protein GCM10007858_24230 [Bradyrhizobium liaoningense]